MKRIFTFLFASFALVCLTACGGSQATSETGETTATALSEYSYRTEIKSIFDQIESATDSADTQTADGIKALIDRIKPLYAKIKELTPPEKFVSAHQKLVTGSEKSEEILLLSEELVRNLNSVDSDSTVTIDELQEKINAYGVYMTDMDNALTEIYGEEVAEETAEEETVETTETLSVEE